MLTDLSLRSRLPLDRLLPGLHIQVVMLRASVPACCPTAGACRSLLLLLARALSAATRNRATDMSLR
jgi:hypothetical protein